MLHYSNKFLKERQQRVKAKRERARRGETKRERDHFGY